MKLEIRDYQVLGLEMAIHAMRNPMDSWDKSDSWGGSSLAFNVGPRDAELALKLIKAGKDHRKFLRLIHIQVFLVLPRYILTELDTYKVATTRLSCSTMHKLGHRDLTRNDFMDGLVLNETLYRLNQLGERYRDKREVEVLREMKQILPEGYLQGGTFDFSYETAINIYHARKNHRMKEWHVICDWIKGLPMMDEWL